MTTLSTQVILNYIDQEARKQGVDPRVARAIFSSENGSLQDGKLVVNPSADTMTTSPKGAMGVMQVMPATFQGLQKQGYLPTGVDYSTPQGQIKAAIASMRERMDAGVNDPLELAISYNGGPAVLAQYKKNGTLNPETTTYLQKFQQAFGGPTMATSTSVHTSSKIIPDDIQAGLDDALGKFRSLSTGILGQLQDLTDNALGATNTAKFATNQEGQAGAEAAWAKGQAATDSVNIRNNLLDKFGININGDPATNQAITRSIGTIQQAQSARAPLGDEIARLQGTNPLENPLGWLVNNFKAMGKVEQYNALARRENAATEDLQTLQALATNQAALQPSAIADTIKLQAQAEGRMKLAEAQKQVAMLDIQASQIMARNLNEQLNLSSADVNQRLAVARLYAEKYGISQTEGDRTAKQKEEDSFIAAYNLAFGQFGVRPINSLATIKLLPRETQDRIVRFAQNGSGTDLADSIATIRTVVGDAGIQQYAMQNPAGGKFVQSVIEGGRQYYEMAMAKAATKGIIDPELRAAKSDSQQLEYGIRGWQKEKEAELAISDYSKLSTDNPAKINYGFATTSPALAGNAFAKYIREDGPGGTSGKNVIITDNLLLGNAVAFIRPDGKNIPAISRQLTDFYKVAQAAKSMSASMTAYGWKQPDKYPIKADTLGVHLPFANTTVDLMSPASVEAYLTMRHARGSLGKTLQDISDGSALFGQEPQGKSRQDEKDW